MKHIERKHLSLYIGLLLNFMFFGVSLVVHGVTLPHILREFGWSYTVTGVIFSAGAGSYFISSFLCGFLAQRIHPRILIAAGTLISGIGLLFFGTSQAILFNILMNFIIGFGHGGIEIVVNLTIVRMEKDEGNYLMSFLHAAFSVGAVLGPLVGGVLVAGRYGWRSVYVFTFFVALALFLLIFFLPFKRIEYEKNQRKRNGKSVHRDNRLKQIFLHPMLLFSAITIFVYVGIEVGISNWIGEYFVTILGSSKELASFTVSLFWFGILAGRFGVPIIAKRILLTTQLIILTAVMTGAVFVTALFGSTWTSVASFVLAGIGCSLIYPLVMSLIGRFFPINQSIYIGAVSTAGGLGSFLFPMIMAAVSDFFGLRLGLVFFGLIGVVMLASAFGIRRQVELKKGGVTGPSAR
jgi:fucose permease